MAGAVGMASIPIQRQSTGPADVGELKLKWVSQLEARSKSSWRTALKLVWNDVTASASTASLLQVKMMLQRSNVDMSSVEAALLYHSWASVSPAGSPTVDIVLSDLQKIACPPSIAYPPIGKTDNGMLERMPAPGSKSRSNLDSEDTPWVHPTLPASRAAAAAGTPAEAPPVPPGTAAQLMAKPPKAGPRGAHGQLTHPIFKVRFRAEPAGGDPTVNTTVNNKSSVEGGIFGDQFLNSSVAYAVREKHSNAPSLLGGIFEDHSAPTHQPPKKISRSQRSSVPGGILAPDPIDKPGTAEYGYERFPRQGLDTLGAQHMKLL